MMQWPFQDGQKTLERYLQLRRIGNELNSRLIKLISKSEMKAAADRLGILSRGVIVFGTENQADVLFDHAIFDWRDDDSNVIDAYMAENPPISGSDEEAWLNAAKNAYFSVFKITDAVRGLGILLDDLICKGRYAVTDVNLSNCDVIGETMLMRLFIHDDFAMSSGTALPLDVNMLKDIISLLKKHVPESKKLSDMGKAQRGKMNGAIIKACLRRGATDYVHYADPGDVVEDYDDEFYDDEYSTAPKIGRNDPCPCGSGKKYKKCCGR
ncbi:MAG TPA: SEC-C metal-binding domain-containing protein [Candidatus Brocadiia bacterium]|nr:SEC-C metal-binding domain-containing protein [Candidatus Brocadiia bacterium]